jgi:uncharacterized protein (UPF0335 family)
VAQSLSSAGESNAFSNSAARAVLIRESVGHIAKLEAEAKAINAAIRKYKAEVVRGNLGFKISDFNAVCRIAQLESQDRDELLECVREGFAALGIGGSVDWVDAAQRTPRGANGAPPNEDARAAGRQDGLGGVTVNSDRWPQGVTGHSDYAMGVADGEAERDRIQTLGDAAPRRGRGRPRKQPQEAEADAEF